ncbi:MAG TPA: ATP synthase F1 subunit delta [Pirellulales bacterium]|nr:ATP synthase F1 subunit delta [Pirellulales bacterium]
MIDSPQSTNSKSAAVNVGAQQVAMIYAKAFLGAAEKAGQTDSLIEEFNTLIAAVLDPFPGLEAVFASALISHEEKSQILDRILGSRLSPLLLDFLKVISQHGRLDLVRAIHHEILKLYDNLRGRVRVQLHTATPIPNTLSGSLVDSLRKLLGGEPKLDQAVDPALIGGIVLRVGDTVYDGSVARQLHQAREQMITRSVHEIQSRRDRLRHSGGN